ncbi:MAG: universal stress protein [Dehalococcoidia bacterium]|jgi:nucleotide-binding universal stress UspA family protein|nr:universal stress protein [Dehalococcoidia bacterium]|tara:strand:+ start:15076 stop:15987 length:912 start_codon:yes stop_codon:yes gene_type:complete
MYTKILVPLDGSKTAETILPNVMRLARESTSKVVLLTVDAPGLDSKKAGPSWSHMGDALATLERPDAQMKAYMDSAASMLAGMGVEATTVTVAGEAAEEILIYATDNGCDLIAMSTRGRSALKRGLMGSVTDAVVRASDVPVLAVGPKSVEGKDLDGSIRSIAVPLDGSDMAETVLPHVEKLANLLSLDVFLLRVVRMVPWAYGAHERVPMDTTNIEAALELEAKEYLATVADRFTAKGITCRTEVLHGVPWDKIVNFSTTTNDMMVAISTHGRSGITRFVLGSVADMLIRSLETPVLVVRPL